MSSVILAGDVGGSKIDFGLYEVSPDSTELRTIREDRVRIAGSASFDELVAAFLEDDARSVALACFGVAGPVRDGIARGVNLPWTVSAKALESVVGARVVLLNDLESTAFGTLFVDPTEIVTLHEGTPRDGNRAVIAAGTGLGQGFLFFDVASGRYVPVATEGGHVDFAPRDDFECRLLARLRETFGRVSYERVLSGPGLTCLFETLVDDGLKPDARVHEAIARAEDPNTIISAEGVAGTCPVCEEALDRFVSLYGAQAGNLALTIMATGGVWIGGGIVTKILPKMQNGPFLDSFRDKGRYVDVMLDMPVRVLLNARTSLLGAAHAAREHCLRGEV